MDEPIGDIIRTARYRYGVSQATLALRAGTTQAVVSRIESGLHAPTLEMVQRLLAALGEEMTVGVQRMPAQHDPQHLAAERALTPAQRLERAFAWTSFNESLRTAVAARGDE